jgi:hypothetical protein
MTPVLSSEVFEVEECQDRCPAVSELIDTNVSPIVVYYNKHKNMTEVGQHDIIFSKSYQQHLLMPLVVACTVYCYQPRSGEMSVFLLWRA